MRDFVKESLSEDEVEILRTLHFNNGFNVYLSLLKDKFEKEYHKLRRAKDMKELDLTNGYLSGLEYAINAVDYVLQEAGSSPQEA